MPASVAAPLSGVEAPTPLTPVHAKSPGRRSRRRAGLILEPRSASCHLRPIPCNCNFNQSRRTLCTLQPDSRPLPATSSPSSPGSASAPSSSPTRSEEHTSELQSRGHLVCRLLLEKKNVSYHDTNS